MNVIENHLDEVYLDARKRVLDFYLIITIKKKFNNVNKLYFVETFDKSLREKTTKKFKPLKLSNNDSNFVLFASSSSKTTIIDTSIF